MGLTDKILRGRKFSIKDPETLRLFSMLGHQSAAGIDVNPESAMSFSAVYCATKLISESVGSLPLPVYERQDDGGKTRSYKHPLYKVTQSKPNEIHTSMDFWTTALVHLLFWGNFYCEIDRDPMENVTALWPLPPDRTKAFWINPDDPRAGVAYKVRKKVGNEVFLPKRNVFHVPGLSFDGLTGRSVIGEAKNSIGLGIAQERLAGSQIQNGQRPGIALKLGGAFEDLSDNARKSLREDFVDKHAGYDNAGKPIFLEEGMEITTFQLSNEDAQFLESRQFTITEIARWFNMPPHKLKDLLRATFSNIEEQNIEWVQDTLRPWCVRVEQAITVQLLQDAEQGQFFAEFIMDALMRGNAVARADYYGKMINGGMLMPNEARAKENFNPAPGLDQFFIPLNMKPYAGDDYDSSPDALPAPPPQAINATRERQLRSVAGRKSIRESYSRVFREATTRVVRGERRNVMRGMKGKSVKALDKWLNDFYYGEHQQFIIKELKGAFLSLAEALAPNAADLVNMNSDYLTEVHNAVNIHTEKMAYRFAIGHFHKLQKMIGTFEEKERSLRADEETDYEGAFDTQFDEWEQSEPENVAMRETVRTDGMISTIVWGLAGIASIVWVSGSNCCPWCQEMDGVVVGIDESFLDVSDSLKIGTQEFNVNSSITTPPLHLGCICGTAPSL